jgi:oligopeptide transport system substrate-binding protein
MGRGATLWAAVWAAVWVAALAGAAVSGGCTNNPYPDADAERKIFYTGFNEAPRTLDPAVAYTTAAHAVTGHIYDTLLEYHYLKRPYTLIPGLAEAVPTAEQREGGRVVYRFSIRPGLLYQDDPCFALGAPGRTTREITAVDVAFELTRIGDSTLISQVMEPFSNLVGFRAFSKRLDERRKEDATYAALPAREQYARLGGIEGVRVLGPHELEIELSGPYPQILYWFAMPFSAPVPWEAVEYYDGREGRPSFADHPVGAGPYRMVEYDKQSHMILEVNANWYGLRHPEWRAPGAMYPTEGAPGDREAGLLDPRWAGLPLPFIERIEFRREKESIPAFNKFLQGYYDASGIIRESFEKVIREDGLSPEMQELGVRLEKSVIPAVYYIGFNMDDPVVGRARGDRSRKLRQAMSLLIDTEEYTRLFMNGRGVPAQSPLPPGLFGYEADYRNPFRPQGEEDVERARRLLAEAGYPDGLDPETGRPLRLTFDSSDTTAQGLLRYRFFVDAWRKLGIDVEINATNYNQFQKKMRDGAYQVFMWGWVADYPDPENFYFLLTSKMARSVSAGPNSSNFKDEHFDEIFEAMRVRPDDAERLAMVRELRGIVEWERPWIELFHPEDYTLFHEWLINVKPFGMSYPVTKYRDLKPSLRATRRREWNRPVMWPAYALAVIAVVVVIPGIVTFYRERQ